MTKPLNLIEMGKQARAAAQKLAVVASETKKNALLSLAKALESQEADILQANALDIQAAEAQGMNAAMLDRLSLKGGRLKALANDVRHVASMPDPVGEVFDETVLPNGLKLKKQRVPIGVLGVIYESRPNVTIDVASLALKTGNSVILRGGSETLHTNRKLIVILQQVLQETHLPPQAVQFIDSSDRAYVKELLHLHPYVDLIIPRGGANLHQFCRENSTIPVITGGIGICHLFVDESADIARTVPVIVNAKTQRPTVCNALDTLLVHAKIADAFLPRLIQGLKSFDMNFYLDEASWKMLQDLIPSEKRQPARPQDWDTEWLSLTLGIKIVPDFDAAVAHIQAHSSGHSDGILTQNQQHADRFVQLIDSAAVYVNASTRFTDGGQFGLGAEVAISTQKLHARGPMGLKELTSYKWVAIGDYHTR